MSTKQNINEVVNSFKTVGNEVLARSIDFLTAPARLCVYDAKKEFAQSRSRMKAAKAVTGNLIIPVVGMTMTAMSLAQGSVEAAAFILGCVGFFDCLRAVNAPKGKSALGFEAYPSLNKQAVSKPSVC